MLGWCVNGQVATSKLSGEAITYFVSAVPLSKHAGVGKDFFKIVAVGKWWPGRP